MAWAGAAAKSEEGDKIRDCPTRDEEGRRTLPFDFTPMVFEVFGFIGPKSDQAIQHLAKSAAEALQTSYSSEVELWRRVLGKAVQQGNARIFLQRTGAEAAAQQPTLDESISHIRVLLGRTRPDRVRGLLRRLQREWHPDKNPGWEEAVRPVFEFVQAEWEAECARGAGEQAGAGA